MISEYGRKEICRIVGITSSESIFIKSEDAFADRMDLLNTMYNTEYLIEIYENELRNFKSEEEYIEFLDEARSKVVYILEENIKKASTFLLLYAIEHDLKVIRCRELRRKPFTLRDTVLNIEFEHPMYEAYKYLSLPDMGISNNIEDYILGITNSKLLSKVNDIDYFEISDYAKNELNIASYNLAMSIFGIVTPKFINSKDLSYVGSSILEFATSENKTAQYIEKIKQELLDEDTLRLENANIEIYKIKQLAYNRDIALKESIAYENCSKSSKIVNYNSFSLVAYLRKQRGEQLTEYDKYIETLDGEAKLSEYPDIHWIY